MAFSVVGYNVLTPSGGVTSRSINVPAGVADGDMIHVFLIKTGGTSFATKTTGTGYTEATAITATGYTSQYWHKANASAADAGVTLTFTTTTTNWTTIFCVVTRGQTTSVTPVISQTTATVALSKTLPSGTAAATIAYLAFMGSTGTINATTDYTSSPSMTRIAQSVAPVGSGTGGTSGAVWVTPGPIAAAASYGGNTLTQVGAPSGPTNAAWLVALELIPETLDATVYPTSQISNSGWTPVGAASTYAALADASDSTYAETGDNPAGSTFTVAFPTIGTGDLTVRTRHQATAASPVITRAIALLQGSTVIATRTITLGTSVTAHTFTLTAEELATVTDRSALRLRFTDTAA